MLRIVALIFTFLVAALPLVSGGCTNALGSWSVTDLTLENARGCQEALALTVTLGATTLTAYPQGIEFSELETIYGSLTIQVTATAQLAGAISFPKLREVAGKITIYANGDGAVIQGINLSALESVLSTGGISIYTAATGGIINGPVLIRPKFINNSTLTVAGPIVFTTGKFDGANIGNIQIEGLLQATEVQLSSLGGTIGKTTVNKNSQHINLVLSTRLYVWTYIQTTGGIGDTEVYGLASTGSMTLDARNSSVGNVFINGSATQKLSMIGQLFLRTIYSVDGSATLGHVVVENAVKIGSVRVDSQTARIESLSINKNSPGVKLQIPSGAFYVSTWTTTPLAEVGDITVRGLTVIRGYLQFYAYQGPIGNIKINDVADGCDLFNFDSNLYLVTFTYPTGSIGDFTMVGLNRIFGAVTITANAGSIGNVAIGTHGTCTNSIDITGTVTVQSSTSTTGSLGSVSFTNLGTLYGAVNLYPNLVPFFQPVAFSGTLALPMSVVGTITISPGSTAVVNTYVENIAFSYLASAGAIAVAMDISQFNSVSFGGHPTKGLSVAGAFTLSSSSGATMNSLSVTNLVGIEGGITMTTSMGQVNSVLFQGLATGFNIKFLTLYSSASIAGGSFGSITFDNLRSVYVTVDIRPNLGDFQSITFNGANMTILGNLYVSYTSTFVHNLVFENIRRIGGYVQLLGNVDTTSGLISINGNLALIKSSAFTVGSYITITTNSQIKMNNLQEVGGYIIVSTSSTFNQLPVFINGTSYLGTSVNNYVRVSSATDKFRSVTFNNMRIIKAGVPAPEPTSVYFSTYRTLTSYNVGPVYVNGQSIVKSPGFTAAYSGTAKTSDAGCINFCSGRGYGVWNTTVSKCQLPCTCWQYNNGTYCEQELVCEYAPTCDCRCGAGWAEWVAVTPDAAYRTRSCDISGTDLECDTIELSGSVDCAPDVEWEVAPATPTSHRVCAPISAECDYENQFESKPYTLTSDRVCSDLSICLYDQWESVAKTNNTDRECSPFTQCVDGSEFILQDGTPFSDVVCQPCTGCGGGLVSVDCTPTLGGDTVCRDCASCNFLTQYIDVDCVPALSQDRVCATCYECDNAYEYMVSSCDTHQNTLCTNYTVCDLQSEYQDVAPTSTTDRHCATLLQCSSDPKVEYELTPPTQYSNRVCQATSKCTAAQFETQAPTHTSNRLCQTLTPFNPATQYVVTNYTLTSDRVVAPLTVCNYTYAYESPSATLTSDRVCLDSTSCTGLQYQSSALTSTTDRVCTALRVCNESAEIQFAPPTPTTNRVCVPLGQCTAFQFESVAPTATTQRQCSTLTTCNNTVAYQSVAPTATTDRQCTNYVFCSNSEYESVPRTTTSDPTCSPLTACVLPSEYEASPPTLTSNRVCGGITVCGIDEYETKNYTATTDRQCATMTDCGIVGQTMFQSVAPTVTTDRTCTPLTTCISELQYQSTAPTFTTNRVCTAGKVCDTNTQFQNKSISATSDRQCGTLAVCTSLQYEYKPPTPTTQRSCLPLKTCVSSEFELTPPTETTDRRCQTIAVCKDYQKESGIPTATSDRECVNDYCAKFNPCSGRGNCTNVGSTSFECSCTRQYFGTTCGFTLPLCVVSPNPVQSPCDKGLCYKNGTEPICICDTGYTGENCTEIVPVTANSAGSSSSTFGPLSSTAFGAIVGAGALLILLLIIIFVAFSKIKAQKEKMRYSSAMAQNPKFTSFENPGFKEAGYGGQPSNMLLDDSEDLYQGKEGSPSTPFYDHAMNHGDAERNPAYTTWVSPLTAQKITQVPTDRKGYYDVGDQPNMLYDLAEDHPHAVNQDGFYNNVQGNKLIHAPNSNSPRTPPQSVRRSRF